MAYVKVSIPKIRLGAGAPKTKEANVIFILAEDVESMPSKDGVVSTSDIVLKEEAKAMAVYMNPKSINRFNSSEGETSEEMGGCLSNFTGSRPGDDEFFAAWLQEHLNVGFLIRTE